MALRDLIKKADNSIAPDRALWGDQYDIKIDALIADVIALADAVDLKIGTGVLGQDLNGTLPNPTVVGIQTVPVLNTTPTDGQVLTYDGVTAHAWKPGNTTMMIGSGTPTASALTLGAGISLLGSAGAGTVGLGSLTGTSAMPTGNWSWFGAATSNFTARTSAGGAITLDTGTAGVLGLQSASVQISNHNNSGNVQVGSGNVYFTDSSGGANMQMGFFGAASVAQPSTTGTSTGFTAGTGTAVKDDSTFTGGSGSKAYRISDIVKALKDLGLLAAS